MAITEDSSLSGMLCYVKW